LKEEAISTLQQLQNLQSGRVRIGANESTSLYLLPRLILAFREMHPKVKIEVFRQVSARLPNELRQRNMDFAIISFLPEENHLQAIPIMRDQLVLIASPEHPLPRQEREERRGQGSERIIQANVRPPHRCNGYDT